MIKFNFENSSINEKVFQEYSQEIARIHNHINQNVSKKDAFLGWVELPTNFDKAEFERIKIRPMPGASVYLPVWAAYLPRMASLWPYVGEFTA